MATLVIHESGRKTITNLSGTSVEVRLANGKIDKPVEERQIHGMSDKEIQKAMERPQSFDEKKYAQQIIKKEK